jgi:protein-disulfide isomerase
MVKVVLLSALVGYSIGAAWGADQAPGTVIAEIDGVKVTRGQFEQKYKGNLFQARNTYYEAERKAVDEYITEYLLERQAQKEHISVAELLERHVNSAAGKEPSEEALRLYYEGVEVPTPYEAVRDKLLEAIKQRRITKARAAYIQSLRADAKINIQLTQPRMDVPLESRHIRGAEDAPVVLVEYADFECPYCQQIQPALDKLETDYKGRMAFVYKDYPLPMHPHAEKAAEATQCAATQGKFWEYHDWLVASKEFEIPQLKSGARKLNLDGAVFDKCLDSGEKSEFVKAEFTEAQQLALPGTPAFFINGRFVSQNGVISYDTLRQMIEEELQAKSAPRGASAAGPEGTDHRK